MTRTAGEPATTRDSAPSVGDQGALKLYRQEKLELADCLLTLMHLAEVRQDDARVRQIRALAARLAEDRFSLAVVGQFSRGKSTLMNAILGASYLPTGALPMTSIITTVIYGSKPRATIRRRGGMAAIDTPLAELQRYVAQASTEREELRVASAEIELPAEILRLGFAFIDTPGVGSTIATNTETTLGFLPEADAVIFVTSFDSPLTETELAFLGKVANHVKRIFPVLNKRDLVSEAEANEVERFVAAKLREVGFDDTRIFQLSAREGLTAKQAGDIDAVRHSGLAHFEAELIDYLTTEKSQEFLLRIAERTDRLLSSIATEATLAERLGADPGKRREVEQAIGELTSRFEKGRQQALTVLTASGAAQIEFLQSRTLTEWAAELSVWIAKQRAIGATAHGAAQARAEARELESQLREPVAVWSATLVAKWCATLERELGSSLVVLDRLPASIETEIAERFETTASNDRGDEEDRRPRLTVWRVPWSMPAPRATAVLSRTRAALLEEAINLATTRYVEQIGEALSRSVAEWFAALDGWSASALQTAAERVLRRLVTPADAAVKSELSALAGALDASRARVESWVTDRRSETPAPYGNLEGVGEPEKGSGCVLCEQLIRALFEFMAHYQFELATRLESRVAHAAGGGFCAVHTWYYAEIGSPVGVSASYARLSEMIATALRTAADEGQDLGGLRAVVTASLSSRAHCPACARLAEVRARELGKLRDQFAGPADQAQVPPLCLDHVADLLREDIDVGSAGRVLRAIANRLERRAEDMRTYSLKRESLRRSLLDKEEDAAYFDVLLRLVGDPLLSGAARHESQFASPFRGTKSKPADDESPK